MNDTSDSRRMTHIDAMRGIASLAVAWFHFTNGNGAFLRRGFIKDSGAYGWAGVEMFFVISGFIIPYTLFRARYSIERFPRFLGKRVLRLDPPYVVAIAVIVGLGFASALAPGFRGSPFTVSWRQVALHLCYVNAFVGEPWLNPVFWTLAIEFQYYLLIGMLFPLLASPKPRVRGLTLVLLATAAFLPISDRFIVPYLPIFLLGVCAFYYRTDMLTARGLSLVTIALAAVVLDRLGVVAAIVSVMSMVLLLFDRVRYPRVLIGAGAVSYSLYLLHVPIGGRVINLSLRLHNSPVVKGGALAAAMSLSVAAAYVLYVGIEKPALRLSSRISLKERHSGDGALAATSVAPAG
jgi:peptidoglycan/LPS O-acetylase OafA/YrhL